MSGAAIAPDWHAVPAELQVDAESRGARGLEATLAVGDVGEQLDRRAVPVGRLAERALGTSGIRSTSWKKGRLTTLIPNA